MVDRHIPGATYRIQLNQQFRFDDVRAIVPYLHRLGITDLYSSPVLQANQGSDHGYDLTDPTRINLELGGMQDFTTLVGTLQQHGMGLLLDIVPNHMAASSANPWWQDVLENGQASPYAGYFDIDWRPVRPDLAGKVLLPVLGAPYGQVLENQELVLQLTASGFQARYYDTILPLAPATYATVLQPVMAGLSPDSPELEQLQQLVQDLSQHASSPQNAGTVGYTAVLHNFKQRLWQLYTSKPIKNAIDNCLQVLNGRKGEPASFDLLDQLLANQYYRLAYWQAANQESNYRRFFNIIDLVSLRMEDYAVFQAAHSLIRKIVHEQMVTGLRIDHVDGLADPRAYLEQLQQMLCPDQHTPGFFILVEKILHSNEELPVDWPVAGTTGYDWLNNINGVLIDAPGLVELDKLYTRFCQKSADFASVVYTCKHQVMAKLFGGEVRSLARQLGRLAAADRYGSDLTLIQLEQALVEVTAHFSVYRTYTSCSAVDPQARQLIDAASATAIQDQPELTSACTFLRRVLLLEYPINLPEEQQQAWLEMVQNWQQFTGPVAAKGVEDTALYRYHRLISLNEVGSDPGKAAITIGEWHHRSQTRLAKWPHTLNATATHDTKRGEDVRARLNVLPEIPAIWSRRLHQWHHWNQPHKTQVNEELVPTTNQEYLIYQTLLGAWPLHPGTISSWLERLQEYLIKAAREAKKQTRWSLPDEDHEQALVNFAMVLTTPRENNQFLLDFLQFQQHIAYFGAINSLGQVLLKITSPGIPDIYQGTELWDLSLVDPDNRRPVDFQHMAGLLATLQQQAAGDRQDLVRQLLATWHDGQVKLFLTNQALNFRQQHRQLFVSGLYLPLEASGPIKEHVLAFARQLDDHWVIVVVPRLLAKLQQPEFWDQIEVPDRLWPLPVNPWEDTMLELPLQAPEHWYNVLTDITIKVTNASGHRRLLLADLLQEFPVALLAPVRKALYQETQFIHNNVIPTGRNGRPVSS